MKGLFYLLSVGLIAIVLSLNFLGAMDDRDVLGLVLSVVAFVALGILVVI